MTERKDISQLRSPSAPVRMQLMIAGAVLLFALIVAALVPPSVSHVASFLEPYVNTGSGLNRSIAGNVQLTPSYTFPLKRGASNRLLYDQNDRPFFWSGDTAWSLIVQLSKADAVTYLDDRAAKGFNAIVANLIEHRFADRAPSNISGDAPFTGSPFITPNEAYFAHADYVINQAAARGIVVLLDPLYLGYQCGIDGWCAEVQAAPIADMTSWGNYVGNRYKNFPNIVWLIGGDTDPTPVKDKVTAFVNGLLAQDNNHLLTAHNNDETLATTHWQGATWLNLNNVYSYDAAIYREDQSAYNYSPTMPFFMMESSYENEHSSTPQLLRSQAYYSVLSGAVGYNFGNCPIWNFNAGAASGFCSAGNWKSNLGSAGSVSMQHVRELFDSIEWHTLVPDWNHTVVTAGYGIWGSTDYVTAAFATNLMVAYVPSVRSITVDMTRFLGFITAQWYDPTNGTYAAIPGSPFPNTGSKQFIPPGNNSGGAADWVLVLKASTPIPPTPTPTDTATPVPPTPTFTATPTDTPVPTPTLTPTPTMTFTPTPTFTATPTLTPTPTFTPTATFTAMPVPPTATPTPTSTPSGDIALLRPTISVSSTAPESSASYAVDGDNSTFWTSAGGGEQTIGVDLGNAYHIDKVILKWGQAYASYYFVETSNDGIDWPPVYTITNGTGYENVSIGIDPRSNARYLRLRAVLGAHLSKYELASVEVYPVALAPTPTPVIPTATPNPNIALLRPTVSVSSTAPESSASYAVDGDNSTYWTSAGGGEQTIGVDLGSTYHITNVALDWGNSYATYYYVEISSDGTIWVPVWTITNGTGYEWVSIGVDPRSNARYVRVRAMDGKDPTKYELMSFEVYSGS